MPADAVPRALHYVGLLFLFSLASTFAWWAGASVARAECRRLLHALACGMRIFFYSICLLCILVALRAFDIGPRDPRSTLFSWIHLGGTVWISAPSAWRAFRTKGAKLVIILVVGWALMLSAGFLATQLSDGFADLVAELPYALSRSK
ncbi:MAG: hypothetical protein ACYTGN_01000 [Planctomycetota bacterium]|jgi:hypothetical protein